MKEVSAPGPAGNVESSPGLRLIAGFKLLQGFMLAFVGTGLLVLVSKDANGQMTHWLNTWQLNTDNDLMRKLLGQLDKVSPVKFERLSAGAFLYAVMLLIEGTGLLLHKRWAEYLTVFVTGSFLPWELWEIVRHFNLVALVVFAANAAVVWYLVVTLRNKGLKSKA